MKRILVIEDDVSLREFMIKYFLEKEGYFVITAENGEVGLQKAKVEAPDLIICDIMMPKMNGYEVIQALHQQPSTASIPFIFLTAMSDRANIRDGMNLGADDFLTKPFVSQELISAVGKRLEKKAKTETRANERLEVLRTKITSVLPHEFRTPLSTILSASNILLDEYATIDKEELREMVNYINISAQRLNRLIENYLLYINLENVTNTTDMRNEATLVSEQHIRETAFNQVRKHHRDGSLVWRITPPPTPTRVAISEGYLNKVIEEVIDNCCKFSEPDTPITITMETTKEHLTLEFVDEGIGMTVEQIQQIGAFMQFNRETQEQQGGGFGLTLAKKILELHDATMHIESSVGTRTMIRFSIPVARQNNN
jgi:two-component system, sensor histidine kinase and response regulator